MTKNIPCVLFLLSFLPCNFLFSQDSLPSSNKKVLEYVNSQIGKKINIGLCFFLVAGALDCINPDWRKENQKRKFPFIKRKGYVYGKRINRKKLLPGDFIYCKWRFKENKSRKRREHICVVYSIDKNGNIKVVEQNADGKPTNKTKVEINNFDPTGNDMGIKIYKLRFYRPY